jgi:hypothetical protein
LVCSNRFNSDGDKTSCYFCQFYRSTRCVAFVLWLGCPDPTLSSETTM